MNTGEPADWDVCIVGAGPAGLAVATQLAGTGLRVCVLEIGGTASDPFPHVRPTVENPYPHADIDATHSAGIGGTARQWSFELHAAGDVETSRPPVGCRYLPMQPLDLLPRPEIGTPGWPIDRAELDHWSERAHRVCGLGPYRYDAEYWSDPAAAPLSLDDTVVTSMFQFGPADAFTGDLHRRLVGDGVAFLTGTTALWLEPSADGRSVAGVRVADRDGTTRTVTARRVILATGGLEAVRLLLDTGLRHGRTPGNHADLLGRYFMEHLLVRGGLVVTDPRQGWLQRLGLYGTRRVDGTYVSAKLTLSDEVVAADGLLATSALLVPRDAAYGTPGARALFRLRSPSGRRARPFVRIGDAARLLGDLPGAVRATLASRAPQPNVDRADWPGAPPNPRYSVFELLHQTEQSPDPDHRLSLAPNRDALGRSELELQWRWSAADRQRIARARDRYAQALAAAGVGETVNTDWDDGLPRMLGGTHHHLGVTRMATDPERGVVDEHCRVHHWDNLYVVGGSVFPSGGFVNPTLTVVALALRLGAHLRGLPRDAPGSAAR